MRGDILIESFWAMWDVDFIFGAVQSIYEDLTFGVDEERDGGSKSYIHTKEPP